MSATTPRPAVADDPAEPRAAYAVKLSPDEVRECPKLSIEANGLKLETGPVALVPISCEKGVAGAVIVGPGSFAFTPPGGGEAIKGKFRSAVLRFNPGEYEKLVPLTGSEKVTDLGATELARHLLRSVLVHCYQRNGRDVLIPPPGALAAVVYSREHGDLLISGNKEETVVHDFTANKTLFEGK